MYRVIRLTYSHSRLPVALPLTAFFRKFTTGAPHPLSLVSSVPLPENAKVKLFGDHLLVTGDHQSPGWRVFSAISWKTGIRTEVSGTFEPHRVIQILRRRNP